jgi:hypothetical protein
MEAFLILKATCGTCDCCRHTGCAGRIELLHDHRLWISGLIQRTKSLAAIALRGRATWAAVGKKISGNGTAPPPIPAVQEAEEMMPAMNGALFAVGRKNLRRAKGEGAGALIGGEMPTTAGALIGGKMPTTLSSLVGFASEAL